MSKLPTLPAGLLDNNIELFAVAPFKLKATYNGKVVAFDQLPPDYLLAMREFIEGLIKAPSENLEADAYCLFGGFDNTADYDQEKGTFSPEYWICGQKDTCKRNPKLCLQSPNTPSGRSLSPRELEFIILRAGGSSNKEIADKMGISEKTVITLYNHVKEKIVPPGVAYPDHNFITTYAYKNGLVEPK